MFEAVLDFIGRPPAWIYRVLVGKLSRDGASKKEQIETRSMLVEQLVPRLGLPVAIAALVGVFADVGESVDPDFYSSLAQVLPVLALAGFVELMPVMRAIFEEVDVTGDPDWERNFGETFVQSIVYAFVGYLILGEGMALWAVGSGHSSTFLLLATCSSGLLMVWTLTKIHLERYDPLIRKRSSKATERLEAAKAAADPQPAEEQADR